MKRSKVSLTHKKLATFDMGELIPLTWYEALPGDTIQQSTAALIRVSPLLKPVMHPVKVRIHHWLVPIRLLWDDFENFITGGPNGTSTPTHPHFTGATVGTVSEGTLSDYLGLPPANYTSSGLTFSALPFRAYDLIFNEHYRDQDLVTELTISTNSGSDTTSNRSLQNISWEKDYFTTCRSDVSKGDTITIPLLGDAPITGIGTKEGTFGSSSVSARETDGSGSETYANAKIIDGTGDSNITYIEEDASNSGYPNIRADLTSASGVDINDLRLALSLQKYQEARQLYGSRYVEYLRYLGVRSSDARLQNPEYLGGGRQTIQFSEVLSTDGSNTGDLKGHGIAAMRSNRFRRFVEEHSIVMTTMSVVPKAIYTQGVHRGWSRTTKEDYFVKELQHIGEQEVYNKEVYSEHTSPDGIFGYQNRYDEYRYHPSTIAGEFRTTENDWHLGRIFSSDPSLNSTFVEASPTKRVLASSSTDGLYVQAVNSIQARRLMSQVGRGA